MKTLLIFMLVSLIALPLHADERKIVDYKIVVIPTKFESNDKTISRIEEIIKNEISQGWVPCPTPEYRFWNCYHQAMVKYASPLSQVSSEKLTQKEIKE